MQEANRILQRTFYNRDTAIVARDLLGKRIVRRTNTASLVGVISEVEAYYGREDSASHASKGRTARNSVMFGPAGVAYIYFVYGMHDMFNIVTGREGVAGAVLIRGVIPVSGVEAMIGNRNGNHRHITDGPARFSQAFAIDKSLNGWDLTVGERLWLEDGEAIAPQKILTGPRIGIEYADRKDREALLRFWIDGA